MLVWVQVPSPAYAEVAELADAHGSGPCGSNTLRVRLPSSAGFKQELGNRFLFFFCKNDECNLVLAFGTGIGKRNEKWIFTNVWGSYAGQCRREKSLPMVRQLFCAVIQRMPDRWVMG